jgi:integration host factor subunit beta
MTKSELIEKIAKKQPHLPYKDVELSVKTLIEQMAQKLSTGNRIEIRGFGSFSLHFRPPRIGRNPKTGEAVALSGKYVPHFKPGKELREKVNNTFIAAANSEETQPAQMLAQHAQQS